MGQVFFFILFDPFTGSRWSGHPTEEDLEPRWYRCHSPRLSNVVRVESANNNTGAVLVRWASNPLLWTADVPGCPCYQASAAPFCVSALCSAGDPRIDSTITEPTGKLPNSLRFHSLLSKAKVSGGVSMCMRVPCQITPVMQARCNETAGQLAPRASVTKAAGHR